MTRLSNISNDFRTAKRSRNDLLREAAKNKRSIRGFLLGFAACLAIMCAATYEIVMRFA